MHKKQKIPNSAVEVESYRGAERYITISSNPLPETWPHMADIDSLIDAVVAELGEPGHHQSEPWRKGEGLDFNNARRQDDPPSDLIELIDKGPPPQPGAVDLDKDRSLSAAFHHAVCWLKDLGWTVSRIEARIAGKPIVPERFTNRLREEIARSLHKAKPKEDRDQASQDVKQPQPPFELFWHGKEYNRTTRSWLVKELIPETGQGLLSGQWGTAKTFAGMDLAAETMIKGIFAGRDVARKGGVVFVAAEGANEIPIRLEGLIEQKLRPHMMNLGISEKAVAETFDVMPFAWIEDCPNLQDDGDFARLLATIKQAEKNIREQFNLPLVLIEIDTLSAAGNFKDANDAAEGQRIMNRLGEISRQTGAFVLAVDHFGKMVETGTRGTSAKEAAADVVLALLADRDTAGNLSNTRMAVRKLRGGKVGTETAFDLRVVNVRFGETTCVVEWKKDRTPTPGPTAAKDKWTKSLKVFRAAMANALAEHGAVIRPFGSEGPAVRAVSVEHVRQEFRNRYPADTPEAKKKAFARSLNEALSKTLVTSWEVNGVDHVWFSGNEGQSDTPQD